MFGVTRSLRRYCNLLQLANELPGCDLHPDVGLAKLLKTDSKSSDLGFLLVLRRWISGPFDVRRMLDMLLAYHLGPFSFLGGLK